jgi:hypothetical protein
LEPHCDRGSVDGARLVAVLAMYTDTSQVHGGGSTIRTQRGREPCGSC